MLFLTLIYLCTIYLRLKQTIAISNTNTLLECRYSFINYPNRHLLSGKHKITHHNATLSGIQPSGELHIGNYLGCIKPCLNYQENNDDLNIMIADHHAISSTNLKESLKVNTKKTIALLLASGINPEKTTIFVQSQFPQILEMNWIISSVIRTGKFYKLAQFQNRGIQSSKISIATFLYPLLMASDILTLNAKRVIAGPDQRINLSLVRYLARKLNSTIGSEYFTVPEALFSQGYRVKSLSDGRKKMSKSGKSKMDVINILDSDDEIHMKIIAAKTQCSDDEKSPELKNLLRLYSIFSNRPFEEVVKECDMSNFLKLKTDLFTHLVEFLSPIRREFLKIYKNDSFIDIVLEKSKRKLNDQLDMRLREVKNIFKYYHVGSMY